MTVHQCPRCELRFALRGDLVDHVRRDHPPEEPSHPLPAPADVRVLVPLDPTRPPDPVLDVATSIGTDRTVLDVVTVDGAGLPPLVLDAFLAAERERAGDARIEVRRLPGPDVVDALLREIARTRPDLVVLASHGRGPLGELLLGSVSADLVRSSPSPTLLVGPACAPDARLGRLVVAVDGSPDALGALDVASHLAARLALSLELVEVAEVVPYSSDVLESAELHRLAESVDPPVQRWDVLHGTDVPRALLDHVGSDHGAVLVLGTHGRSPDRPHVIGGVAARTVRHAAAPVLLVSPEAASTVAVQDLVRSVR